MSRATISLVAEQDGTQIGFCAANRNPADGGAAVLAILVDPASRRMGVGTALLEAVQQALAGLEVTSLALGYGGDDDYFWPGVPESQRSAWAFFVRHGWCPEEHNFDLVVDLAHYRTPDWVAHRLEGGGATLHFADAETSASIVHFERENFPEWTHLFEQTFARHEYRNVLCAKASGAIIGAVLLNAEDPVVWNHALGLRCGSFGILGVARIHEGKGIGLALAARALETVQERGCPACYIGWTGLVSWYAKLGATVWSEYRMGRKQLVLTEPAQIPAPVMTEQNAPVPLRRWASSTAQTAALSAAFSLGRRCSRSNALQPSRTSMSQAVPSVRNRA